ncbi:MAG: hypothetical protein IKZ09_10810 [Clostridia bacterium]|nr:hypothetical protein [Clostridia bacterium]
MLQEKNNTNEPLQQVEAPERAIENFWYHYKWPTLIVAFFAVFFLIAIAQMGTKNNYDAHLLYTGPAYLDGEVVADILTSVDLAADQAYDITDNPADHDGDGSIHCDFNKIVYVPTMTAEEYKENDIYFSGVDNLSARGQFDNLIMIGEYVVLMIDQSLYDETVDTGAFCKLSDILDTVPEYAYDECGILLSDLPICAENGFRQLPDDTVLCCRGKSYVNNFNKKVQKDSLYDAQVELFRQIVSYQRTGK